MPAMLFLMHIFGPHNWFHLVINSTNLGSIYAEYTVYKYTVAFQNSTNITSNADCLSQLSYLFDLLSGAFLSH